MTAQERAYAPGAASLDGERARLRAAGLTDDEISRVFVGREIGAQQASASATAGASSHPPMTGALANISAVWGHARGIIPAVAAQILTVRNSSAPSSERLAALLSLMVKAAVLLVFCYVVSLELIQFRLATDRARAETCSARNKNLIETMPGSMAGLTATDPWVIANHKFMEECRQ